MGQLESHFKRYRQNIVGHHQPFQTPYGEKEIVYADWTASGRLYEPIEGKMLEESGPFVGNTHSEANVTGTAMTHAYHCAHQIIKTHVNPGSDDALLFVGYGMTSAMNKLQRILGVKVPEHLRSRLALPEELRPVVFVTHMEHHSNQTTWCETIAEVVVLKATSEGLVDLDDLRVLLQKYKRRPIKIGSFTAYSNVTGIEAPYRDLARIMHEHGGLCVVDCAASAPYMKIDMHPAEALQKLDAITLSPHKFLGGPGTSGVLIFDSKLYHLNSPDQPGGGTVLWTNPWGEHRFIPDIEIREDGGTPGFLQAIKAALAVRLKEEMGVDNMACAGTYGHYLLHVDRYQSKRITDRIDEGDLSAKPGWVRLSVHPTTTDEELEYMCDALRQIRANADRWASEYGYDPHTNEFKYKGTNGRLQQMVERWFTLA